MFSDFKNKFNHGEISVLKNYDYSLHRISDPSRMCGPDRLLSYHAPDQKENALAEDFDLEKEIGDVFEFKPTKLHPDPPRQKKMAFEQVKTAFDSTDTNNSKAATIIGSLVGAFRPLKKKSLVEHQESLKHKYYPTDSSLYLGSLMGTLKYMRKPNPLPKLGESFKGLRNKPQESTVTGKFKVAKKDYRRYLIEVKGDDGLIMGHLDDGSNNLLSSLMDSGVIEVWITLDTLPPFTSPSNESTVSIEISLMSSSLTAPIMVPISKAEELEKSRFEEVKDKMIDLIRQLNGNVLKISKDVATKPLNAWKISNSTSNYLNPYKDNASLELLDADNRVQLFIDTDLNDAGVMECDKDPELFSKDMHLMQHQRFALTWLKMREGILGYNPNTARMFDSEIHPMWCELEVSIDHPLNAAFKSEYCSLVQFTEPPTSVKIFFNPYSGQLSQTMPAYGEEMKSFKGGILADEMGLGKTVMMVALVLSNRLRGQQVYVTEGTQSLNLSHVKVHDFEMITKTESFSCELGGGRKQRVFMSPAHFKQCLATGTEPGVLMDTLVVVPTSLVYQWRDEIKKFSAVPIKVLVYSEDEKVDMFDDIRSFDVVIVSYNKLSYDFKTGKSKIHGAYWYRVILDECHYIRNRRTQLSKAVCALKGERRWCLSGTPIQNSMDDLFSLVAFMNYAPWSDYHWWNQNINMGLADPQRKAHALSLMNKILKPVMLRRTKQQHQHLLGLKTKTVSVEYITLNPEDRERYDSYYLKSKKTFQDLMQQGNLNNCYMTIWPMLMKLRQLCDHFLLAKSQPRALPAESIIASVLQQIEKRLEERRLMQAELTEEEEEVTKKKGREVRSELIKFEREKYRKWIEAFYYSRDEASGSSLKVSQNPKEDLVTTSCPICLTDDLENPIITSCGHFGCLPCMNNWLSSNRTCPYCSFVLRREDLISIPIE